MIAASYGFAPERVLHSRDDGGEICAASPGVHVGGPSPGSPLGISSRSLTLVPPLADDPAAAEAFAAALDRHRQESGLKGIEVRGDCGERCRQRALRWAIAM